MFNQKVFEKCSWNTPKLFQNNQICFANISVFGKHSECLSTCPDCSIFQSLLKLLIFLETFQSVLEYFKFVFEIFQKCFGILRHFSKVFQNIKMFFKSVLKHSALFSRLSYFRMFRNFQFIPKHSDLFSKKVFPSSNFSCST